MTCTWATPPTSNAVSPNIFTASPNDYVDANIPIARRMFEKRKKGYAAMGYEVEDSKSQAEMSLSDEPSLNL